MLLFLLFVLACLTVQPFGASALVSAAPATNKGYTAIVIGAGPAGLAMALGLCRLPDCRKIHLVEKYSSFDARGANFLLANNGQKALEKISAGICDEMLDVGIKVDMVPKYPAVLIPWWMMRNVLLERVRKAAAEKDSKVEFHMGKQLSRIIDDGNDGVCVHFTNDDSLVLKGDMLVGADGVNSAVREQLGLPEAVKTGLTAFRGHVDDARKFKELLPLLDKGFIPMGGNFGIDNAIGSVFNYNEKHPGKLAWVAGTKDPITPGESTPLSILDPAKAEDPENEDLLLFRELIKRTSEPDIHFEPFPEARVVDFSDKALKQYSSGRWGGRGRITLIGDAAHAFPAADGQGGSQAFEDAYVLTRLLQEKLETQSIAETLAKFEQERLPRVKVLHKDQTEKFAKTMKGESEQWSEDFMEWVFEGV